MNWDLIRVFLAVVRNGSATGAAKTLDVNHATVIRRIKQLELNLSVRLFDHLQSGYRVTEAAQMLVPEAEAMEAAALSFSRVAQSRVDVAAGVLKVSMPESAFIDMSLALKGFRETYPQVLLQLLSTPRITNMARLEADVVMRLTNEPPELLVGKCVRDVGFGAYAHVDYKRHWLASKGEGAASCEWVLWSGSDASPKPEVNQPVNLLRRVVPDLKVTLSSNSMAEVLAMLRTGAGVGLLSHQTAREYEELVLMPFDSLVAEARLERAGLWLLTHRDLRHSERVNAFMRYMAEALGDTV
ncbi:LysR family transcriptional regulator [Sinobacterium caligoides]|nr:LysR family transcriptional regulator [Sinobacterium caligoides]